MAATSGLAEVAAGQMADQQGSDDEVKSFGRQMVRDHTKANDALKQLAAQKGVSLPTVPDARHQKALAGLKQKENADFDQAYVESQLKDHQEAVKLFGKAANSKDPDIAAFAGKTLTVLKEHLTMIKALDAKLKKQK
jgi:putative membrane protein